jgi:heme/copper-type cytochrome/quinol oxidase subunit 2
VRRPAAKASTARPRGDGILNTLIIALLVVLVVMIAVFLLVIVRVVG